MNANTFYESKARTYRAVTLRDALVFADTCYSSANVTILSPDCGDQNVTIDEKNFDTSS